jgi:hypothetical protein
MLEVTVITPYAEYTVDYLSFSFDFKHVRCYFYVVTGVTAALKRKEIFQQLFHLMLVFCYQCIIINWWMLLEAKDFVYYILKQLCDMKDTVSWGVMSCSLV